MCQLLGSHGHNPSDSDKLNSFLFGELYFEIVGALRIGDQTLMNIDMIFIFLADGYSLSKFKGSFGWISIIELSFFLIQYEHPFVGKYARVVKL